MATSDFTQHTHNTPVKQAPLFFIVAVPIGNPGDITLRALTILQEVDSILCEDTRVTNALLAYHHITASLHIYNDFSDAKTRSHILHQLQQGKRMALVSDAGTPLISDPGYKLVQLLQEHHIPYTSIPGASSVITALTLAGLPLQPFTFLGFLPDKKQDRETTLSTFRHITTTLVIFEAARKLLPTLEDLHQQLGNREAVILRELTKTYEAIDRRWLKDFVTHYTSHPRPKGEIVLVIAPPVASPPSEQTIEQALQQALLTMRVKEAANFVAESFGIPKKQAYQLTLKITSSYDPQDTKK